MANAPGSRISLAPRACCVWSSRCGSAEASAAKDFAAGSVWSAARINDIVRLRHVSAWAAVDGIPDSPGWQVAPLDQRLHDGGRCRQRPLDFPQAETSVLRPAQEPPDFVDVDQDRQIAPQRFGSCQSAAANYARIRGQTFPSCG